MGDDNILYDATEMGRELGDVLELVHGVESQWGSICIELDASRDRVLAADAVLAARTKTRPPPPPSPGLQEALARSEAAASMAADQVGELVGEVARLKAALHVAEQERAAAEAREASANAALADRDLQIAELTHRLSSVLGTHGPGSPTRPRPPRDRSEGVGGEEDVQLAAMLAQAELDARHRAAARARLAAARHAIVSQGSQAAQPSYAPSYAPPESSLYVPQPQPLHHVPQPQPPSHHVPQPQPPSYPVPRPQQPQPSSYTREGTSGVDQAQSALDDFRSFLHSLPS